MALSSSFLRVCFILVVFTVVWCNEVGGLPPLGRSTPSYDVRKFGAVPDGKKDNSKAFVDAWKEACNSGGTVVIPGGVGTFVVKQVCFEGPCNGAVKLQVNGEVKATAGDKHMDSWFSFHSVNGLIIHGKGKFDGNGASVWKYKCKKCPQLPKSLAFYGVSNANIQGITSLNSKGFHLTLDNSNSMRIEGIKIIAPGESPNTDGIHMENTVNVQILRTNIATGDDCVSIGQGSKNINLTRVDCGPGHGISIGSIGKHPQDQGVNGVHVRHCSVTSTQNGLRIKTWVPSPSVKVSDVTFQDIKVINASNPIIIDQHYCVGSAYKYCPGESSVKVEKVKFINVVGLSNSDVAVNLNCSRTNPCHDIMMNNINLKLQGGKYTTSKCVNAKVTYSGKQIPTACH